MANGISNWQRSLKKGFEKQGSLGEEKRSGIYLGKKGLFLLEQVLMKEGDWTGLCLGGPKCLAEL